MECCNFVSDLLLENAYIGQKNGLNLGSSAIPHNRNCIVDMAACANENTTLYAQNYPKQQRCLQPRACAGAMLLVPIFGTKTTSAWPEVKKNS